MSTFIGYLTISIPLAVLSGYIRGGLGCGSMLANLVVSLQCLATLLARPYAGRIIDGLEPKYTVFYGMAGSAANRLFMLLLVATQGWSALSPASLLVGRLILGAAESLAGSAAIGRGIGRIDAPHTARVISWNDIASYGTITLGAPLGVLLVQWLGLWSMGVSIVLLGALGFTLAWPKLSAPLVYGERLPFHHVLGRVILRGMGLVLGAIGFDTIATFITLCYASRSWTNAILCLSAFGGCFIGAQLLFANGINRFGGFRAAIVCLDVEDLDLPLLWSTPDPWVGLAGTTLTGSGFSLVFPAFGVETVNLVPTSNRGTALSAYSLFVNLSLGITRPLVGFVANLFGSRSMFLFTCLASLGGLTLAVTLHRRSRRPG